MPKYKLVRVTYKLINKSFFFLNYKKTNKKKPKTIQTEVE